MPAVRIFYVCRYLTLHQRKSYLLIVQLHNILQCKIKICDLTINKINQKIKLKIRIEKIIKNEK